jgi:hypothetical protein
MDLTKEFERQDGFQQFRKPSIRLQGISTPHNSLKALAVLRFLSQ